MAQQSPCLAKRTRGPEEGEAHSTKRHVLRAPWHRDFALAMREAKELKHSQAPTPILSTFLIMATIKHILQAAACLSCRGGGLPSDTVKGPTTQQVEQQAPGTNPAQAKLANYILLRDISRT